MSWRITLKEISNVLWTITQFFMTSAVNVIGHEQSKDKIINRVDLKKDLSAIAKNACNMKWWWFHLTQLASLFFNFKWHLNVTLLSHLYPNNPTSIKSVYYIALLLHSAYNVALLFISDVIKLPTFLTDELSVSTLSLFHPAILLPTVKVPVQPISDYFQCDYTIKWPWTTDTTSRLTLWPFQDAILWTPTHPNPIWWDQASRPRDNNLWVSCTCCIFTKIASQIKATKKLNLRMRQRQREN